MPDQQVGVAPRPVDVGGEGVEPQDAGALVVGGAHLAVDAERAGQEVDAEVGADAGVEQVLHLLVGLVAGELGVEVEHDEARGAQAEPGRQAADDHLGDEHLRALAGAAELADVGAEVVALDDAGQAAALAQRGDVARDGDERESGGDHWTGDSSASRCGLGLDVEVGLRPLQVEPAQRIEEQLGDGEVAVPLLVGGDDVPRCDLRAGPLEHESRTPRGTSARTRARRGHRGCTSSASPGWRAAPPAAPSARRR